MDGEGHGVADTENGPEGVGPEAHVGDAAEVLEGGVLLLEGEAHWVAFSQHLYLPGLDFHGLAAAHGGHQFTLDGERCAGSDALQELFVEELRISDNLNVIDGGTVVEGNEFDLFVASFGADPAFGQNLLARLRGKQSLDFASFYGFHKVCSTNYANIAFLAQLGNSSWV